MSSLAPAFLLSLAALYGGIQKLPVIDRQDIRFVRLRDGSEPFRTWTSSIAQDNYGFIWLGTDDGLYRYDGYILKPYRHDSGNPRSLSDNTIKALYKDRGGILWVGTGYGGLDRFDPARDTFTHFRHDPGDPRSLSDDTVCCILRDQGGRLWVGTNGGLDRVDEASGSFIHYQYPSEDQGRRNPISALYQDRQGFFLVGTVLGLYRLEESSGRIAHFPSGNRDAASPANQYVSSLVQDRSGLLWVTTPFGNGLSTLDARTGEFTRYSFTSEPPGNSGLAGVNTIYEDRNGVLWLGTYRDGLLKFDRSRKTFLRYSTEPNLLFPDDVGAVFEDLEGNMWVGGNEGVSRFPIIPQPFVNYKHDPRDPGSSLQDDQVLAVHADASGFLWIGTTGGLHRLDRKTGQVVLYQHHPDDPRSLSYNEVSAITEDGSGGLWIGTHGGGLNRFDRVSGRFSAYRNKPHDAQSLSDDLVQSLLLDSKGVLWVGTHTGGLNRFVPTAGSFETWRHDPADPLSLSDDNIREISEDGNGSLWIGTNHGLDRFDPEAGRFTVYLHDVRDASSLSHNSIGSIYEDRLGELWIGTRSGLDRFDQTRGSFETFTTRDGLADDAIEAIREDNQGNLWLATHRGLSRFQPQTKAVTNYTESDGLPGNFVNPGGTDRSCRTPGGELVFGSEHGVTMFDPDQVSENRYVPPVMLTDFLLFSKPISLGSGAPLQQPIWAARSVTLSHRQNIFSFVFSALSYAAPEKNHYRYRLADMEKEWNLVDSGRRIATYTNLPPGKYVFQVQASNGSLIWNDAGVRLDVIVLPPWWGTWWFRSLAFVTLAGLVYAGYQARVRGLYAAASRLEAQVAQRTSELQVARDAADGANRAKSAFLANMSHEMRNPLSSILAITSLLRQEAVSSQQREYLETIDRSGEHLLSVINAVLDIAKVESGEQEALPVSFDVVELARDVVEMARPEASRKKLTLEYKCAPEVQCFVRADAAKLRQVLLNILANAIKFTGDGSVTLRLTSAPDEELLGTRLRFEVEDTGIGIAPQDQARIFEPFVQVGRQTAQRGTGLGLAITRRFVEMMGGNITLESQLGRGSRFCVEIPAQFATAEEVDDKRSFTNARLTLAPSEPECRVLIVEDDPEIGPVMEEMLRRARFEVRLVGRARDAIEVFEEWKPHFIWMDLWMPEMSGTEVAQRIRQLQNGRTVKIAAMTAAAFESDREQVLAAGMDDFVSKPYRPIEVFDCLARHLQVRFSRPEP